MTWKGKGKGKEGGGDGKGKGKGVKGSKRYDDWWGKGGAW